MFHTLILQKPSCFVKHTLHNYTSLFVFLASFLAGVVARRWNQLLPSLLTAFEKLQKLGFAYENGKVIVPGEKIEKEVHE